MLFFLSPVTGWVIFALGIINLVSAALILASCRVVPGLSNWMKHPGYKSFYKMHVYLWWIFWPSVIIHTILATTRFVLLRI